MPTINPFENPDFAVTLLPFLDPRSFAYLQGAANMGLRTAAQRYIAPPRRLIPLRTNPNAARKRMRDALLMLRGIKRVY